MSLAEVAALPATVDLVTAGRALGIGRTTAHKLARAGRFPCPVLRPAGTYRVPTAALLKLLGIEWTLPPEPIPSSQRSRSPGGRVGASGSGWPETHPQREHDGHAEQNKLGPGGGVNGAHPHNNRVQ